MAFDQAVDWWVVGPLITYLGAFPVSMKTGETLDAMREALGALGDGAALIVFPEGEREFADGEMLPFKTGTVRIALDAGVPILPVTVRGGNRIWPRGEKYPRFFRPVEITYHELFYVERDPGVELHVDLENLTARLKEIISQEKEDKDV